MAITDGHPAEMSGLSQIEEHSARALLAKPTLGADDAVLLRAYLRKALETITGQRLCISSLASLPSTQAVLEGQATRTPDEIVAAVRQGNGDAVHVFSDADVAFEVEASHRIVRASWRLPIGVPGQQAMFDAALWHRRRAATIARIIEEQERRNGWLNMELLLPDTSWRRARFDGGPLDGEERAVSEPAWSMWVARREPGLGLDGMTFVQPAIGLITSPNDPSSPPPPLPDDGTLLGLYRWDPGQDCYDWMELGSEWRR